MLERLLVAPHVLNGIADKGKSSQIQHGDDEVSPIDATPDSASIRFGRASHPQEPHVKPSLGAGATLKPATSSIPVLRREKRRNQVAETAANLVQRKQVGDTSHGRKTSDVRWDPYSGEITTSNKGKPQSVKPGEYTPPAARSTSGTLGNSSTGTAGPKVSMSFGERVRKLKPADAPVEKPEWKGATGRVALVSPVTDQPDIRPISIPRKSSRRVASPIVSGPSTPISAIRTTMDETGPVSSQDLNPAIRAVPTRSGDNSPKGGALLSPAPESNPQAAVNSAVKLTLDTSPPPPTHQKKDSVDTIERNFREALQRSFNPNPAEPYVQPPSRFSVTTYATSTGDGGSPRQSSDSNRPPLPTQPHAYSNTQEPPNPTPATPILNRKRPKIGESTKSASRKSAPSSPVLISMTSSIATKRPTNKSLPKSPPEAGSQDLISSLQAQLDDLGNRRSNIMKSIRQMTELMPTDNVVETDGVRRKREDEKRKIEFLREEEADIRSQEHDIGLKLHRAWKRKDNDAAYEPTGLWVKRVGG